MKQWSVFVLTLISFLFLASCQEEKNYNYFMQHPQALKKAIEMCERKVDLNCEEVNRAEQDFAALITERAEGPELFGLKIMRAQERSVNLLTLYRETEQTQDNVKIKSAALAYDQEEIKIKVLYAVIVATSQGM